MWIRTAIITLALFHSSCLYAQESNDSSEITEASSDDPEAFLDRVDPEQRTFLRRLTPYFARLPNGRCVSIFREAHIWHVENGVTGFPVAIDAEHFDYEFFDDDSDKSVRHQFVGDIPKPTTHGVDYLFASGLKHGSRLHLVGSRSPDAVNGVIVNNWGGGAPSTFCVVGIPESARGSTEIMRPVLLWRDRSADKGSVPAYRFVDALESRPTAGELAMAVAEGKAELVTYRVSTSEQQKKKKEGKIWKTWTPDGPLLVTHTWERRIIQLRLRDVPTPRQRDTAPKLKTKIPEATDEIRLADGRVFHGRLIDEDEDKIVFEIIIGRARGQLSLSRDEVIELIRGERAKDTESDADE